MASCERAVKRKLSQADARRDLALTHRRPDFDPRQGGPGYDEWFRERVMALPSYDEALWWVNEKTLGRWIDALAANNTLARVPHAAGAPRRISAIEIAVVHMLKRAYPTMSADELTNNIARLFGRVFSPASHHARAQGLQPVPHDEPGSHRF
jgi:hypothetical protein